MRSLLLPASRGLEIDKPFGLFYVQNTVFLVDDILVSDDLLDAPFACNLGACLGACCVQGDSGAPLDPAELETLEDLVPVVRDVLSAEAVAVIERRGPWERTGQGGYATSCVDGKQCVFVTYEGQVAKCALHRAHAAGRTDFPKPLSCHLYPVRVSEYETHSVVNYEKIDPCLPARKAGRDSGVDLGVFLREPLVRKFGQDWYDEFVAVSAERREAIYGPRPTGAIGVSH